MSATITNDIDAALQAGAALDLGDARYGAAHWAGGEHQGPEPYYRLLAGLVRTQNITQVLEVGTHEGGATLAMTAGLAPDADDPRFVTLDVTFLNEPGLAPHAHIERIRGDSLAEGVIVDAVGRFDRHIDLLFVDAVHDYRSTIENVAVYANALKPRWLVLDDIRLNPDMRRAWSEVVAARPGACLDVSERVDRAEAGFGVVRMAYPHRFDEHGPAWRRRWRALWKARRELSARVPYGVKERVRRARNRISGARLR